MKRSKFFRVATEGATTDGRKISKDWIVQAAKNFSLKKYSPRVWLEHIRGVDPESLFKCYGDVVAVEAREVEDGKMALFAQISPTDALIEMNKNRQKLYTSIEINPSFADTGEAYLVGLGITDSPASLGTEMLQFSEKNQVLANRKQSDNNLFSEGVETVLEFEDVEEKKSILDQVKQMFSTFRRDNEDTQQQANNQAKQDFVEAAEHIVQGIVDLEKKYSEAVNEIASFKQTLANLEAKFNQLDTKLSAENFKTQPSRPTATGTSTVMAEC